MNVKERIIDSLNQLPYISRLHKKVNNLQDFVNSFKKNSLFPVGHYYSPLVLVDEIATKENKIWPANLNDHINGIDLNTNEQLALVKQLSVYYKEIPFKADKQPNVRYYFENDFYSYTDGIILYSMIRHFKPKRIIEIGSGFSSAVMLDTNELFFDNKLELTFIEPYSERLQSLLKETDRAQTNILEDFVQNISVEKFKQLQSGDILFIDSSHVAKTGSDLNYILFEILPILNAGVKIHFHDIFYPFEYPKKWVLEGRSWNEAYFLRAFLMYNKKFKVEFFSEYIHKTHNNAFSDMPLSYTNHGGSLWLEKQ